MELQITWGYTKQKRFIRFKKWQKVDCLYFVCWRRLCDWSRELDCKYHSLEPTQKLFQGHFKGLRRMLQILMRKIKLQKGLTMGARSKIESSQEAILSLKKHILDFQDFFFSLPKIKIQSVGILYVQPNRYTLLVQDFRLQKNYHSQFSVPGLWEIHRNLKQQKKIQFAQWLLQKIPFLYFFLHRSWMWRTLGHVMNIFYYWHFHNDSKEYF